MICQFALQFAQGCLHEVSGVMPVDIRQNLSGFKTRHVEKIADHTIESRVRGLDFSDQLLFLLCSRGVVRCQSTRRTGACREGSAQFM